MHVSSPAFRIAFLGSSSLLWNACFLLFFCFALGSSLVICNARFFLWFYFFLGFSLLISNACDQLSLLFCCCLLSGLLIFLNLIIQMDMLAESLICSVGFFFTYFAWAASFPIWAPETRASREDWSA